MKTELDLVSELGINRSSLRRYRSSRMAEGVHWLRKGRTVCYTEEGAAAVREWRRGVSPPPEPDRGIILRQYPNPNLLRVELPDGSIANVRVRPGRWVRGRVLDGLRRLSRGLYAYQGPPPRK